MTHPAKKEKYGRRLVFETTDEFSPIEITENDTTRALHLGTISTQTVMEFKNPYGLCSEYNRMMMLSLLFNPNPQSVLFLGLGGGAQIKFMWKYFPKCCVDVVERSATLVDVAYKYFQLPKSDQIHIHVCDAVEFLKKDTGSYDIIFVDLFAGEAISPIVAQEDFFVLCHRLLKPEGILSWNTWSVMPKGFMERSIQSLCLAFLNSLLILLEAPNKNLVFIAFKQGNIYKKQAVIDNAQNLQKITDIPFTALLEKYNTFQDVGHIKLQ